MIAKTPWLERRFDFDRPLADAPLVLERLRGLPARLEDRVIRLAPPVLATRHANSWSILEIIGHLIQVEDLWTGRLEDYGAGEAALRPAKFESGRVDQAGFNRRPARGLLYDFRIRRLNLVRRLEGMDATQIARSALHPRLHRPMRLLDMMLFVAEHDDHHLARIGEIVRDAASPAPALLQGATGQVIAIGKHVLLRDAAPRDIESYVRWRTAGEWREYDAPWEQGPPIETDEQKESMRLRFRHTCAEPLPDFRQSAFIAALDDRPLGWVNRYGGGTSPVACDVGIDICEDAFLNRGLGTEALSLWIDYLFANSELHRIGLETWSMNPRMMQVARKVGFTEEGIDRERIRWREAWLDRHCFGILRQEWESRRSAIR